MRRFFITAILLFVASLSQIRAMDKTTSKVEKATIFFRGAELIHTAKATLARGSNELWIGGISPSVDNNSIKVKTSTGAIVSSFEFAVDYLAEVTENSVVKKLNEDIKKCENSLTQVEVDKSVTENLLSILLKSVEKKTSGLESGVTIEELTKTMDYYKTKSGELERELSSYDKKIDDLNEQIEKLQAQLNQESVKNNKRVGILKLNLSSPVSGPCEFTISYYTPAATWVPFYDINVASTDSPVSIISKAKVRQTTGLDWEDVKISLSTSVPSNGKVAPLFSAWFLRDVQVMSDYAVSRSAKMMVQNTISYDAEMLFDEKQKEAVYEIPYVAQSESHLNITYDISVAYTIPGNGKEQNVELTKRDVNATFKYYCAPKLDPATYVIAEIADWNELNLLNGVANVTYDGTYVGETRIDANSTENIMSLTLGTDTRIPVTRVKMKEFSGSGIFGSDVREESGFKITVKNNQNRAIKMVVKDQYPISTYKDVTVELSKDTTPFTYNNTEVGVLTWEYELKPGESRTYDMIYTVKKPKGRVLE